MNGIQRDLRSSITGVYNQDAVRKCIYQFPEIVDHYLNSIGVSLVVKKADQGYHAVSSRCFIFYFEARADAKDYKYFEGFTNELHRDQYPLVNMDAVVAHFDEGQLPTEDFTCFRTETIVTFSFEVPIDNLKDIDNFMHMLKTKTQPIAYRKFSEKIDEEITQELDSGQE